MGYACIPCYVTHLDLWYLLLSNTPDPKSKVYHTMSDSNSSESNRENEVAAAAGLWEKMKNSHIGPRLLVALSSILYASSYPLIAVMNNSYPPSFTTMARMILAFIPLLPFLPRLDRNLRFMAIFSGCFEAAAHITLSLVRRLIPDQMPFLLFKSFFIFHLLFWRMIFMPRH